MRAPIAVFAYKRSDMLARTLTQLAANEQAGESDLFIYCDGPKRPEDAEKVAAARAVARATTGFKSLTVVERETNLGLARSIKTGVTDLCERFGTVIVVEDDLDLSPDFLRFMNEALERYADEPRVMQVAGHMWDVALPDVKEDAMFLSFTTSWGWATWARAWRHYSEDLSGFDGWDPATRKRFDLDGNFPYARMLERARLAGIDSWAIYWYYTVFLHGGLTIYPRVSLVAHRGFEDENRTHGHGRVPWATVTGRLTGKLGWPLEFAPCSEQRSVFGALRHPSKDNWVLARLRVRALKFGRAIGLRPISGD